ncbi:MAG: DUF6364 family protein [Desulfobacteraceae bacterium]|nr:DUF6364 family protein [Desulfobacteraceae bacterium]
MNITLSADEELVKKAREYAARQGTSLNRMIREYMEQLASISAADEIAEEFAMLARQEGGASPDGFVFDREAAHKRKTIA